MGPYMTPHLSVDLRINIGNNLQKLLHIGNNNYSLSANEAITFFESSEKRGEIFQKWLNNGFSGDFMFHVRYYIERASIKDIDSLINDLTNFSLQMHQKEDSLISSNTPSIVKLVLSKKCDPDEQFSHLITLMKNSQVLYFSANVLMLYLDKARMVLPGGYYEEEKYSDSDSDLTKQQLVLLKNTWIKTVEKAAENNAWIERTPHVIYVLFRWRQLSSTRFKEVQDYLKDVLQKEESFLAFAEQWSQDDGNYSGLERLIPPENQKIILYKNNHPCANLMYKALKMKVTLTRDT